MAIPLATMYSLAVDANTSQTKIAAAAAIAAQSVLTENPATANHSQRLAWAQKTLLDPLSMAKKMIWGVVADPNVQAAGVNASDAILQTSVNALVDTYSSA